MKKKLISIILFFFLLITVVLWIIFFPNNMFYSGVYFLVTIIIYLSLRIFNYKQALFATIYVAIGSILSVLLKRDFEFNYLVWVFLSCLIGVIIAFFANKK